MEPKSHQCSICNKSFSRPSKLRNHIAYHHEKKYSFECVECGRAYSNQAHVSRHYRAVHEKNKTKINQKFICIIDNCNKNFANKQNLDRHIRTYHMNNQSKPVKCFYCAELVEKIETHLIDKHNSISLDKFKCLDCSKEFPSVKRLIHHRIMHTDERRETDVRWIINHLLDKIERIQTHTCDICNRTFRSLFQLDQHRNSKIHQNEFSCQYRNCGKRFLHMRNLRNHFKIHHENNGRLMCPMDFCSKTFTCQSSIYRHLTKCHSSNDVSKKEKSRRKQLNIRNLLTGFNSHKLNQENDISKNLKHFFNILSSEEHRIDVSEEHMNLDLSADLFDPHLLRGYNEIGLVEL